MPDAQPAQLVDERVDEQLGYDKPTWAMLAARALGLSAFLAMALFWIWAFLNTDSIPHPDEFDDTQWSAGAEELCATHQAAIAALPNPVNVTTAQERAELVALGTVELEAMLAGLAGLGVPNDDRGADGVPRWLSDYEIYLQDRRNWTQVLSDGKDQPFLISGNAAGARVTDVLTTYAQVNLMPSCGPSPDV